MGVSTISYSLISWSVGLTRFVGGVLFIYLNGVYHSSATRKIVLRLLGRTNLRGRFIVSSTNVLSCRRKRLPSDQVHTRTTHHNCGLIRHSHPMHARSFCSFSLVVKVSSQGVSSLGRHTPKPRRRGGVRHVARCYAHVPTSRIPSPCCKNTRNFRCIVSILRSTYDKLLGGLQ